MPTFHIVLIKLKSTATAADIATFTSSAKAMVGQVPGLISISLGKGLAETLHRGKGFDFGLCAILEKPSDVAVYADHPAHKIVQEYRIAIGEDALALDWEEDVL